MKISPAVLVAMFTGGALLGGFAWRELRPQTGQFAVDVPITHAALERAGKKVSDFAARGDSAAASAMLSEMTLTMRQLNDSPVASAGMHNCRLAAGHLGQGLVNVSEGQPWLSRAQFVAALDQCK